MAAEYAGLETRVSELELQVRHMLPVRIDAVGYGLSLVRADTLQIRATQDIHTAALERLEATLDRQDTRFEGLDARLDRQDTRLGGLETKLDRQGTRLDGLETKLDRQGTRLDQHGELLTEILRRLPEPPAA